MWFGKELKLRTAQVTAALYMRLSKDDELSGESASIENQRAILMGYAESQNFDIYSEYIDDGWSGTNFDRPDFKRMMADAEAKKINCILVKDLSRFGREHVMFGYYLEFIFPALGIRFIAVNNGVDTAKDDGSDRMLVPFMNLMNDMYARDASEKIKSVLRTKMRNGEIVTSHEPLGYRKDPENRHTFIIDEETAPIVRMIFSLALCGHGANGISKILAERHVYCPSYWRYLRSGRYAERFTEGQPESNRWKWSENFVYDILRNEMYIGNMIHLKRGAVSYKNRKRIAYDESKWIRCEGTHPAIIKKDDFDRVQEMLKERRRERTGEYENVFSGIARCSQCGHAMRVLWKKRKDGSARGYLCCQLQYKYYGDQRMEGHTSHYIPYSDLYDAVLREVQIVCRSVQGNCEDFIRMLEERDGKSGASAFKIHEEKLAKAKKRLRELDLLLGQLYEDKLAGTLTERNFKMLSEKYQGEQDELEAEIKKAEETLAERAGDISRRERFADLVNEVVDPQVLTKEMLNTLIDRIVVEEAVVENGVRRQGIEIVWRFVGVIFKG